MLLAENWKQAHLGSTRQPLNNMNMNNVSSRFEDGTLPFLDIIALRHGFDTLERLAGKLQCFNSIMLNPSNAEATFVKKHKDAKIFENHLNPVMLVFIR